MQTGEQPQFTKPRLQCKKSLLSYSTLCTFGTEIGLGFLSLRYNYKVPDHDGRIIYMVCH